jgi:hypothetical protein
MMEDMVLPPIASSDSRSLTFVASKIPSAITEKISSVLSAASLVPAQIWTTSATMVIIDLSAPPVPAIWTWIRTNGSKHNQRDMKSSVMSTATSR